MDALLTANSDLLTVPEFISLTIRADCGRDSDRDGTKIRYLATRERHVLGTELATPDLGEASFGFSALPVGTTACAGQALDCVLAKVQTFPAGLADESLSKGRADLGPKFLSHFIGNQYQPLYTTNNQYPSGNTVQLSVETGEAFLFTRTINADGRS